MDVSSSIGENLSKLIYNINNTWKNKKTNEYMVSFAEVCSKIYKDESIRAEYCDCAKCLLSWVWEKFNWTMSHNGFAFC